MIEIVYTWPDGREEVRYRRKAGTQDAACLIEQVERMRSKHGDKSPYSWRSALATDL